MTDIFLWLAGVIRSSCHVEFTINIFNIDSCRYCGMRLVNSSFNVLWIFIISGFALNVAYFMYRIYIHQHANKLRRISHSNNSAIPQQSTQRHKIWNARSYLSSMDDKNERGLEYRKYLFLPTQRYNEREWGPFSTVFLFLSILYYLGWYSQSSLIFKTS